MIKRNRVAGKPGLIAVQTIGNTDTDGHDQFQFLLNRAGRDIQLLGNFQIAGTV
ncbi:hypothetical protein D3C84_771000 [compost metagenome]